jgi:cephalosporin hydroxylase
MNKPNLNPIEAFEVERAESISRYRADAEWQDLSAKWLEHAFRKRYMYNFSCLGRPIIQLPADMVAFQEVVWSVKPDIIVETGIAHGGSLILSASALAMLDYADAVRDGTVLDPQNPKRRVLGVDIDIREHNRIAIETHPMAGRIDMIQGSSISDETIAKVREAVKGKERVLVCLDSNHTHEHVLKELEFYAPLTTKGSYCLVFDTLVEDLPADMFPDRPWAPGDNPKTAVHAYLKRLQSEKIAAADGGDLKLEIDRSIEDKLLLSVAPDGFLKRV